MRVPSLVTMLAGLDVRGLKNSVFELVSDHLGEDEEWAWVRFRQSLTVTLIATTAPAKTARCITRRTSAYRSRKFVHKRRVVQPVYCTVCSHFAFIGHQHSVPNSRPSITTSWLSDSRSNRQSQDRRRSSSSGPMQDLEKLMNRVFPLGEVPNYEPT